MSFSESEPRRWQFSLRSLFVATTLAALFAAWAANPLLFWPAYQIASCILPFVLLAILCLVVMNVQPLGRWHVFFSLLFGATCALAFYLYLWDHPASYVESLWRLTLRLAWTGYAPLPCWVVAFFMWRVLDRTGRDFEPRHVRTAALTTLLVGITLLGVIRWSLVISLLMEPGTTLRFEWDDFAPGLAIAGGLAAAFPWIKLLRGYARRLHPGNGPADSVAKVLLAGSIALAAFSWLAMAWFFAFKSTTPPRGLAEGLGALLYDHFSKAIPFWIQCGAAGLFVAGFCLELYRDRWHPRLTAASAVHGCIYWAVVLIHPRLLLPD